MPAFTVQDIADRLGGTLEGEADRRITGVEQLARATPEHITFVRDETFVAAWRKSQAGAAVVGPRATVDADDGRAVIRVQSADLAMALVLEMFAPPPDRPEVGVHPAAVVDPSATLGERVAIGAGCVIGAGAVLGDEVVLHPHVTLGRDVVLGAQCELHPGVAVRERCTLGDRVILHANVVIGADGFGYRPSADGQRIVKIPHIGIVRIGSDVEIGACTCVDRGKFSATSIGEGTKIDNLCQIAHNVTIGRGCLIAGQVGLAGSATIGDGVTMGGQVGVRDHITVGDGATLAACSSVMNHVPAGATWGGAPARDVGIALREHAAIRKLPDLVKKMRKLDRE